MKLLKTKDVSKMLGISPDDISYLARKGKIKGFKKGRQWRFKEREVKKFIEENNKREV